jgi:hypothetical protein
LLLVAALAALSGCGSSKERDSTASPACPYHGAIKAADGRVGVACKTEVVLKVGELPIQVASLDATTGTSFRGSARAITTGPVEVPILFSVKCAGYAPVEKQVQWTLVPSECKEFDAGEFVVSPQGPS